MTDSRKGRILIADDNPVNQELLEAYLADGNYEIEFASDGLETLAKVSSFRPDVILLDDYLSKPVHKLELLKRVENMIKLRSVSDELERLRRYIDSIEDASAPPANRQDDSEKEN